MNRIIGSLCLIAFLTSVVSASVRVSTLNRNDLHLYEKTGQTDNLLDNPARLMAIKKNVLSQATDINFDYTEPYDPVYKKSRHNDSLGVAWQTITPLFDCLTVQLGHSYSQQLNSNKTESNEDSTFFENRESTFQKNINVALATDLLFGLKAGYSITFGKHENYATMVSNLATNYAYSNDQSRISHLLGVVYEGYDFLIGAETEEYAGIYDNTKEIDFELISLSFQARRIWGEIDRENLCVRFQYNNQILQKQVFTIARAGYDLDVLNYRFTADAYYYYPKNDWEFATGLEIGYDDKNIFDVDNYSWMNGQNFQVDLPVMLGIKILPYLKAILEMNLSYFQESYEMTNGLTLQNTFGLRLTAGLFKIDFYAMPQTALVESQTADSKQSVEVGFDCQVKF